MTDLTDGKLKEALEFAKRNGDNSLQLCLDRLKRVEDNLNIDNPTPEGFVDTLITNDFAPFSFGFVRRYKETNEMISNGGIIFHGVHDGFGSGSAPTFSVTIDDTDGWAIHT